MTGLDQVERLRAIDMRVPVLLMTGEPSSALIARAERLGAEKVMEKALEEQDLFDFVDAIDSGHEAFGS